MSERILVLGVGNILMRDEGIGPRIIEALEAHFSLPEGVIAVDAGTLGLSIIHLLRDADHVLIVDAVDSTGHPPGTVLRVPPEEFAPNQVMHSLHDVRLVDVLQSARLIGIEPTVDCIGVQVADIAPDGFCIGLTDAVEAALPRAVAATLELLEERGILAMPRSDGDEHFISAVMHAWDDMRRRYRETGSSARYED